MKISKINISFFLIVFVLWISQLAVYAQSENALSVAEGYVYDDKTNEPLPFVNIHFQNTTIGTSSDLDGKYKIKARHHDDTLIFSMIGYHKVKVYVEHGKKYRLIIRLEEESQTLSEIIITPGENPAHPILRNILENKSKNNPVKFKRFNCRTYTSINASIANVTQENLRFVIPPALFKTLPVTIDSAGIPKLPIYLSEKISLNFIEKDKNIRQMQRLYTNTEALMGFDKIDTKGYTNSLSAELNFYNNYLDLFSQKFISPLANNGLAFYRYYLEDSTFSDGHTYYHIKYVPRNDKDLAFDGNFIVVKDLWAITYIVGTLPKIANINYLNTFKVSYTFDFVNDTTLFFKSNTLESSFHYLKQKDESNKAIILVDKVTLYSDILLGDDAHPLEEETLLEARTMEVSKVDSIFQEYRNMTELDSFEIAATTIDSTKNIPWVKNLDKITNMFITGYYNIGKIDLGPYLGTFKYNSIEGNRIGFGMRTSEHFNPHYSFGGSLGYGFKDMEVKYSVFGEYKLNTKNRIIIGGSMIKDLYLFGVFSHINLIKENMQSTGEDSFIATLFKRIQSNRRAMLYRYNIYLEKEWRQGLMTKLSYEYHELRQGVYVPFIHNGEPVDYIYNNSLSFRIRFSWEENMTDIFLRRYYLNTNYPIINIVGTAGTYTVGGDNGEYFKLHLTLKHKLAIGFTRLYYVFEAGRIFGSVPFPLLNIVRGNDTYGNSRYRFNLLNNATAALDTYASIMLEHHFNGFIMNKIPLVRVLNVRTVISAKYFIGSLSNKHQDVLVYPWDMYVPGNHYLELGVGLENIFQLIRIEAIWRPVPEVYPGMPKYGIRVRMELSM